MIEKILALAGGGSGGGGTSDFSTCTMTVLAANEDGVTIPLVLDIPGVVSGLVIMSMTVRTGDTVTIPLYKGACAIPLTFNWYENCTITGNAEVMPNNGLFITGDFSVSWG